MSWGERVQSESASIGLAPVDEAVRDPLHLPGCDIKGEGRRLTRVEEDGVDHMAEGVDDEKPCGLVVDTTSRDGEKSGTQKTPFTSVARELEEFRVKSARHR